MLSKSSHVIILKRPEGSYIEIPEHIGLPEAKDIAAIIRSDGTLKHLSINLDIGRPSLNVIMQALRDNLNINSIEARSKRGLDFNVIELFFQKLLLCESINSISLTNFSFKEIYQFLKSPIMVEKLNLTTLKLSSNGIRDQMIESIKTVLLRNPGITNLDLSDNNLGNEGILQIMAILPSTNIETLNLNNNGLNSGWVKDIDQLLQSIAQALNTSKKIKHIYLCQELNFPNQALNKFFENIQNNSSLVCLDITDTINIDVVDQFIQLIKKSNIIAFPSLSRIEDYISDTKKEQLIKSLNKSNIITPILLRTRDEEVNLTQQNNYIFVENCIKGGPSAKIDTFLAQLNWLREKSLTLMSAQSFIVCENITDNKAINDYFDANPAGISLAETESKASNRASPASHLLSKQSIAYVITAAATTAGIFLLPESAFVIIPVGILTATIYNCCYTTASRELLER